MNINKLATEIYNTCQEYKNCDGSIKVSKASNKQYDVYHAFGSNVAAYEGDSAQDAFDRVVYSINLIDIDWKRPLKKYIIEELRNIKKEIETE
jgi:hypothetical protein